jgi:hypothetical protein
MKESVSCRTAIEQQLQTKSYAHEICCAMIIERITGMPDLSKRAQMSQEDYSQNVIHMST